MELKNIPISPYEEIKNAFEESRYPMTGITIGKPTPVVTIAINLPKVDFKIADCFGGYVSYPNTKNEDVLQEILAKSGSNIIDMQPSGDRGVRAHSGKLNKIFPENHKWMTGFSKEFNQLIKYFGIERSGNKGFNNRGVFYSSQRSNDEITYYVTTPRNKHSVLETLMKKEIFDFLFIRTKEQFEANGYMYKMKPYEIDLWDR